MNNLSSQPLDIKKIIVNLINPENISRTSVKACGRDVQSLALVNPEFQEICQEKLSELKQLYGLLNKYHIYQEEYEKSITGNLSYWPGEIIVFKGNPQLYDALLAGCGLPYAKSSFDSYNEEIESDIKTIVKLTPQSLSCDIGTLRCRNEVTPLMVACCNSNIPIHIVKFLLESGANPNATILVNHFPRPISEDLANARISQERMSQIKELFLKYGLKG